MNKEVKKYSENLDTIYKKIKNARNNISALNYKIETINNKKNTITGRMIYYGIFACCSIFAFAFATVPAVLVGLGIITANAICLGLAGNKKKKYNQEIAMHTNKIAELQGYIDQLTQEASKNSLAISEYYKKDNNLSLEYKNNNQNTSKKSVEFVKQIIKLFVDL